MTKITKSTPAKRLGANFIDIVATAVIAFVVIAIGGAKNKGPNFILSLMFICPLILQLYFWRKSTSLGKKILRMKVIRKETGEPLTFGAMVLRELIGKYISGFVLCLGFIWILLDSDNQGWHDKFVGSVVVDS